MISGFQTRLNIISFFYFLIGSLIIAQIVRLQNSESATKLLEQLSQRYGFRKEEILPNRGQIFDRWGNLLAGNQEVYEVGVYLKEVSQANNAKTIANVINKVLGLDTEIVLELVSKPYKHEEAVYVALDDFVAPDKIAQLDNIKKEYAKRYENDEKHKRERSLSLDGLEWRPHLKRSYPENNLASNIIGFYTYNGEAHLGVEEKYDDLLSGTPLDVVIPIDPSRIEGIDNVPPGASLILTIDREIQASMEKIIDNAVESNGAESGTIIVMDPKTGEILAMATTPRMDPNKYWEFKEAFFNRAIDKPHEPGSVFKVITMSAALDSGSVKSDTPFLDTGSIEVGGLKIYNWDRNAWGPQDMISCLRHSLNVCLAWVATQTGPAQFYDYLIAFGFGHRTNIDLAGESIWPLRVPGGDWVEADLGTNAFGQGIAATPIQMITAISALANDGKMMAPHVLHALIDSGRQYPIKPQVIDTPISPETAKTMTEMLAISLEAEASDAIVPGYRMAGKTGTAEIPTKYGYWSHLTNASFVGWGPVDDPRFIAYIWLEKPTTSIWGSIVAAPIFRSVVNELVVIMNIPPDQTRQQLYNQ